MCLVVSARGNCATRSTPALFIPYRLPALHRPLNEYSAGGDPDGTFQGLCNLEISCPGHRPWILPPAFSCLHPNPFKGSVAILPHLKRPLDLNSYPLLSFNTQGHGLRRL